MRRTLMVVATLCLSACGSEMTDGEPQVAQDAPGDAQVTPEVTPEVTTEVTPSDPNVWHEACPVDEREQRFIDVGDVTLNVACRGAGPTVVFLHGFPEFHYSWHKVMDELASEYRLVAPDQRGYNTSDKPEAVEDYELPHLMEDIVKLLPLVSAEPVILVAHDWGGPVGWTVAHHPDGHLRAFLSTNGPHPLRFTWLIENDPAQAEASSYMDFFRLEGSESYFTEQVMAEQFGSFLSEEDLAISMEAWMQPDAIKSGLNWYRANTLTLDSVEAQMAALNPTVTVPTTVMWGLDDEAVLPQNAEGLEPWVDDLKVETFEGVDHWIEHRIPEEIARAIRELDARASLAAP
jgi:pimeloyl-ACP methyl ester carboxylesterase